MAKDDKTVKLAKAMHTGTVARVGGSEAWGRMTPEVQNEAYAATAWAMVYGRWDEGASKVLVEDIALAYTALLATE